jgi:DNA-binding transcriptional MerR regulator
MDKSPEAFRTISEVAEVLETPAHVLRFWESRFPQIRPVKRAGGRRYYRPSDVALLSGIRHLLHDQGMTIRGVQKVLREQGVRHVAGLVSGLELAEAETDAAFDAALRAARAQTAPSGPDSAEILDLRATPRPNEAPPADQAAEVLQLYPAPSAAEPPPQDVESVPPPAEAPEGVPEAGHVWVEDEPQLDLPLADLSEAEATEAARPARAPVPGATRVTRQAPVSLSMFDDIFIPASTPQREVPVQLSGLAARIRALPRPLSPEALLELSELHSRLGLLHAQIAEALRGRR